MFEDVDDQIAAVSAAVNASKILEKAVFLLDDLTITSRQDEVDFSRVLEVIRYEQD